MLFCKNFKQQILKNMNIRSKTNKKAKAETVLQKM